MIVYVLTYDIDDEVIEIGYYSSEEKRHADLLRYKSIAGRCDWWPFLYQGEFKLFEFELDRGFFENVLCENGI